jgi:prolyl oligopeptidase PreP (S9A serine peptidase family)
LLMTATNDGGQMAWGPRKYGARLRANGYDFYYHEAPEGGHGWSSTPDLFAEHEAVVFTYLAMRLMQ